MYGKTAKIADFGLCCSIGDNDGEDEEGKHCDENDESGVGQGGGIGHVKRVHGGTRGYMAPEQMLLRAKRKLRRSHGYIGGYTEAEAAAVDEPGCPCDIWAFGLLLAMLMGGETAEAARLYLKVASAGWHEATTAVGEWFDEGGAIMATLAEKLPADAVQNWLLQRQTQHQEPGAVVVMEVQETQTVLGQWLLVC